MRSNRSNYELAHKLKEENKRLREALEFYADENNWIVYEGTVETVPGEIARKALEVMEK